jgi:hypothetical protein
MTDVKYSSVLGGTPPMKLQALSPKAMEKVQVLSLSLEELHEEYETKQREEDRSTEDVIVTDQLFGAKRKLKVIVIGAGVSGLNFFKRAEEQGESLDIVCYEKNADIGGTWLENRYPGCACKSNIH